jgi:hypothetical protein
VGRSLVGDHTSTCCCREAPVGDARKEGYDAVTSVPQESSGWVTLGEKGCVVREGKKGDETVGIVGSGCMKSGGGRVLRSVRDLTMSELGDWGL